MTEESNTLTDLFAACWKDDALKARFMADPKAVLAEYGIDVPDGMDVNVVENSDNTVHITMPAPPSGHQDLSDEELRNAARRVVPTPPSGHQDLSDEELSNAAGGTFLCPSDRLTD